MKTRAEIYSQEAAELLRLISIYPGLVEVQLCRFFSGKESKIINLLSHLKRQGRVTQKDFTGGYFSYGTDSRSTDSGLIRSVWILLDFIEQVEYHSSSEFPAKIIFFARSELYEIIYAAAGQESLVNHLKSKNQENDRRIILVDSPEQIRLLHIPGAAGYCTVNGDGHINYYKKQEERGM